MSGIEWEKAGEASKNGGLAGAVGPEQRDNLARLRDELDVEVEAAERADDVGVERHAVWRVPPPRNRSRRPTSTPSEMATRSRLRMMASSGLVSFAR